MNRLAREKSPYLLQHADNPVDWYPWGEEAFERARRDDKPVFLSIGYATCHWCHVMEHESFEDEDVARLLNDAFVCVKVDREERPDVDQTYMRVCQMLTGSGGWPLTIVMTPAGQPFFAGTYIPKQERFGRVGLVELVPRIQELWRTQRADLVRSAEDITRHLQAAPAATEAMRLDASTIEAAAEQLRALYDPVHGGFGGPPKFPSPHQFLFLLRAADRMGDEELAEMVYSTLRHMRRGGIFDHVGFGFHRYATDREWFLPHFEKMLYDQAMLVWAYVEAYQRSGEPVFAKTAREVLEYVARDLLSPEGAFCSAEDADSEGVEGKFYTWRWGELEGLLTAGELRWVSDVFGLVPDGNMGDEAHGTPTGANHFHVVGGWEDAARRGETRREDLERRWEEVRRRLLGVREGRIRPLRDDKVLTDWNGLMISAFARAARALGAADLVRPAVGAADFLLGRMRDPKGRLLHRYRDGDASILGFLDDHAFLCQGLLDLYEATAETRFLQEAADLAATMWDRFWDPKGGFDFTSSDHEVLIARQQDWYDGALPSGNAVAFLCLLRLGRMTGRTEWDERASRLVEAAARHVSRGPAAHTMFLAGLDFALGPTREVVVVGEPLSTNVASMRRLLDASFVPRMVVLHKSKAAAAALAKLSSFTQPLTPGRDGRVYVCQDFRCELPVEDASALKATLTEASRGGRAVRGSVGSSVSGP